MKCLAKLRIDELRAPPGKGAGGELRVDVEPAGKRPDRRKSQDAAAGDVFADLRTDRGDPARKPLLAFLQKRERRKDLSILLACSPDRPPRRNCRQGQQEAGEGVLHDREVNEARRGERHLEHAERNEGEKVLILIPREKEAAEHHEGANKLEISKRGKASGTAARK